MKKNAASLIKLKIFSKLFESSTKMMKIYLIYFYFILKIKFEKSNGFPQINETNLTKVKVFNISPFTNHNNANVNKYGIENKLLNIIADKFKISMHLTSSNDSHALQYLCLQIFFSFLILIYTFIILEMRT